jgi:putative DNA methylase
VPRPYAAPANPDTAPKGFLHVDYPKRLIEVDLPIRRISAHARREKSIRHGHISSLHIWWARRPLAACRAVICAALWPDPADENCPPAFREEARRLMTDWAKNHLDLTSPESMSRFNRVKNDPKALADNIELRKALLDFISDFADPQRATDSAYLHLSRAITACAHETLGGDSGSNPLVVDPFAGGGSIPLEALRIGADAFASDLNPIPVLLNTVALNYLPRYGSALAEQVRNWGMKIKAEAEERLARCYPKDPDGSAPISYLWARTIVCEGPGCGSRVPLIRSLWLAKKSNRSTALRLIPNRAQKRVDAEIMVKRGNRWVLESNPDTPITSPVFTGTVKSGSATCPCCGFTTPNARVRAQLSGERGGASSAQLMAVVLVSPTAGGRKYRLPNERDEKAYRYAQQQLTEMRREKSLHGLSLIPDETIPPERPSPNARGLSAVTRMGVETFGDLFNVRQKLALATFVDLVREAAHDCEPDQARAIRTVLAMAVGKIADLANSCCRWEPVAECPRQLFARQAVPIVWDFPEAVPISESSGSWDVMIDRFVQLVNSAGSDWGVSSPRLASATHHPLPDDSCNAFVTDPPYYDAVPYGDLSDFFYVWLRRALGTDYPDLFTPPLVDKDEEAIWNPSRIYSPTGKPKDEAFYESQMERALAEGRRITHPSGIGVVVFAHKSTEGWEAILSALLKAGWVTTASWPVDTEMGSRVNAMGTASLASSVHLVCRPRENAEGELLNDTVGDWRTVLAELPKRIHEWMPRLAEEGVVGADAIFACLGPALEIFSRYSRVEKASGEVVTLREYLEQVWAAVSTEALSMIFRDADAAGLESDARFTAIVLWTLGASSSGTNESSEGESEEADDEDDDEEESPKGKAAKSGYTLEYDAARKIAQGLGVNLEQIDSVVEVKGDKARLRPVGERAASLFGKAEKAEAAMKKRGRKATQKKLFDKDAEEGGGTADTVTIGEGVAATPGVTALDRVHQAMLLFAGGRADALKRFIVEDGVGGDARFWKLAQSLSALYPAGSDEKRWVDGVLARKKSFGF